MSTIIDNSDPQVTDTAPRHARELAALLDEVMWQFGGQGSDSYCCEDVSYIEYRALRAISRSETVTMQNLGQQLGFSKSGATRIVDRLELQGYVRRERDEDDRRVCCVCLTDAGQALSQRIVTEFAGKTRASLDRLDPNMRDVLMAALRALVQTFHQE